MRWESNATPSHSSTSSFSLLRSQGDGLLRNLQAGWREALPEQLLSSQKSASETGGRSGDFSHCYLCLTASSCFRMSLMSICFSPAPWLLFPAPPIPIPSSPSSPAASGSLLKCMSYHRVPFCSVTSHCWLLHLLFCLQSLTSHYPLCSPIPLFMPSFIVLSFHIAVYICPECSSPHSSYPYSSHPPSPALLPLLPHVAPTVPTLSGEPSSSFCFLFNDEWYSAKLLSKMA